MSGYIHPDEWFQGFEVVSAWLCADAQVLVPWEFAQCGRPARTSLSALAVAWPVLIGGSAAAAATLVWAWCAACNAITFAMVWRLANTSLGHARACTTAALLCTSWAVLVLGTRPLSNTAEAGLVVVSWTILFAMRQASFQTHPVRASALSAAFSACCVFGVFIRFTFLAFVAPAVWAWICWVMGYGQSNRKEKDDRIRHPASESTKNSHTRTWTARVSCLVSALVGATLCTMSCVMIDAVVYGAVHVQWATGLLPLPVLTWNMWPPSIAPLNSLLYNLDANNLAKHGSHPRWLHVVVNMHVLYGPAWTLVLGATAVKLIRSFQYFDGQSVWQSLTLHVFGAPSAHLKSLSACTLVAGLAALSTAPHQEPRFLLPLAPSVCILAGELLCEAGTVEGGHEGTQGEAPLRPLPIQPPMVHRTIFVLIWLAWNAGVGIFFGVFHQAGVVPAAIRLSAWQNGEQFPFLDSGAESGSLGETDTVHAMWYGTYMPPRSLIRPTSCPSGRHLSLLAPWCTRGNSFNVSHRDGSMERFGTRASKRRVIVHDVQSQDGRFLAAQVSTVLPFLPAKARILIIAPGTLRATVSRALGDAVRCACADVTAWDEARITMSWPHLSTEAMPSSFTEAVLDGWLVLPCHKKEVEVDDSRFEQSGILLSSKSLMSIEELR